MCHSWIVCSLLVAVIFGCTTNSNVQVSHAPAVAPPVENVKVKEIAGGAAPPAQITKVVTVTQHGIPVTTLRPSAFRIEEDGQPLDSKLVDLHLLPPEDVIAFHTVLLMDLSAGTTKEGRTLLTESASRFVQELRARQSVTVLAFDGSARLRLVGDFPRNAKSDKIVISETRFASGADPARNLRGAVLEGLDRLDAKLKQYTRPIRVGNLVVFSTGPDQANRATEATMDGRLDQSQNGIYFVGLQGEGNDFVPRALSRSGVALASDLSHLPDAFKNVATLVSENMASHYVLSYCTLARSGKRNMRVAVDVVSNELEVATGMLESQFDAAGFSTGCNAAKPPRSSSLKTTAKN
jgi:hypothetical protein